MDSARKDINQVMANNDIKVKEMPSKNSLKNRQMLPRTLCHSLVIFTLGMALSMRGPSFIDIREISGVDVEKGSLYYTVGAFGYVIGAFFTGVIYSRVKTKDMLIIGPMLVSAIFFSAIPWCTDFVLLMGVHAVVSFFSALTETTANTEEVKRWEGNSCTAMQVLSFSYSLGGIIGPLLVEPFLAPKDLVAAFNFSNINNTATLRLSAQNDSGSANLSHNLYNTTNLMLSTAFYLQERGHQNSSVGDNYVGQLNVEQYQSQNSSTESHVNQPETRIHYAYFIAGVIIVLCSIPVFVLWIRTRKSQKKQIQKKALEEEMDKRLPLKMYVILTGLTGMFYFFYTTIDDPYSMYLSTFVVEYLDWSKEDGALVSSLYWGSSTATKLAMVFLVRHMNPSLVLFCSCLGMVVVLALLSVCAYFHVHIMMWVCTGFMALSQSALFGGGFAWVDAYLLKVDGKVTSCTMILSSLGAMVAPMLLGVTMKQWSPLAFPCLMTIQAIITFAIFLVMLLFFKPYVAKKYGLPRPEHHDMTVVKEKGNLFQEDI